LPYIKPSENSHLGLCVPQIIFNNGNIKTKIKSLFNILHYLVPSIKELKKTYKSIYKQPINSIKQLQEKDLIDLKLYAKNMGIENIGFTKVDTSFIFSDKVILYPNAIVILMEMNHESISSAPSKSAEKEILRTYYELNVAVNKIKEFLNERGYNAQAGPALGGEVNYPLLAQKANLGVIGKHGLLITPNLGPSLRLAAIFTDIENLPIEGENEYLWVRDFCDSCNRCVNKCPANAIYKNPITFKDDSIKCIDYKKCAIPFSQNYECTVCVKECTFFNNDYYKIKERYDQRK
jgi:ferredoxin